MILTQKHIMIIGIEGTDINSHTFCYVNFNKESEIHTEKKRASLMNGAVQTKQLHIQKSK